ncbi:MAG: hypothetical protein U0325_09715 [Polyangiales bacterium]
MTSSLDAAAPLAADRLSITVTAPRTLAFAGEIASRDPVAEVGPHLRGVHDAAAGGGDLTVDVTALTFVNSSGLRLFLDWVGWIAAEPEARRYRLRFRARRDVTWQRAAFPAIAMLGGMSVTLDQV